MSQLIWSVVQLSKSKCIYTYMIQLIWSVNLLYAFLSYIKVKIK